MEIMSLYAVPGIKSKQKKIHKIHVINSVCRDYEININQIYQKTRKRSVCEPRMVVQSILRLGLGYTLALSGNEFGLSDATVYNSIRKVRNLYVSYPKFRVKFLKILNSIFENEIESGLVIERLIDEQKKDERVYKEIFDRYNN